MSRKEQNKILDAKIESNVNQYKVDRLNAEISAFSNGYLSKYWFLKRINLNYKPNALDKARFEFFSLGRAFIKNLSFQSKHLSNYQEEDIIKLLKEIRDNLAGLPMLPGPPGSPSPPSSPSLTNITTPSSSSLTNVTPLPPPDSSKKTQTVRSNLNLYNLIHKNF